MDIKNFFSGMFGGGSQNILHTPNGDFNLAKSSDRKRIKKMVIELQRTTDALTRRDIADWRNAWQMAINVDSPNRQRLYDIYRDVDIDLHLSGCVRQRVGFVMAKSFKLVDAKVMRTRRHTTISTRLGSSKCSNTRLPPIFGDTRSSNLATSPPMAMDVLAIRM